MDSFDDWITQNQLFIYILPLIISAVYETACTLREIGQDIARRDISERYEPSVTYYNIFARIFLVICPVVNILVSVYAVLTFMIDFFEKTFQFLHAPVIPPKSRK